MSDTPQRTALIAASKTLRALLCTSCKAEGSDMARACRGNADCDARFCGIDPKGVRDALAAVTEALSFGSETPADFDLKTVWVVRKGAQWITRAGALTQWLHEAKRMSEEGARTEAEVYRGFPMRLVDVMADPPRHRRNQRHYEAEGVFLAALIAAYDSGRL